MSVKELKGITPLYQGELTKQMGKVLDCWNNGYLYEMYVALQGLIGILNPDDRKELMKNDLPHIEEELNKASKQRGMDLYWTREKRRNATLRVLRENLFNLLLKVMATLHEKGYLIQYKRYETGRELGY